MFKRYEEKWFTFWFFYGQLAYLPMLILAIVGALVGFGFALGAGGHIWTVLAYTVLGIAAPPVAIFLFVTLVLIPLAVLSGK
jgi:hypothetical protein